MYSNIGKRIACVCTAAVLLSVSGTSSVFAETENNEIGFKMYTNSEDFTVGDQIDVFVNLNAGGIAFGTVDFKLDYDETVLQPVKYTYTRQFLDHITGCKGQVHFFNIESMNFSSAFAYNEYYTPTGDMDILSVQFNVIGDPDTGKPLITFDTSTPRTTSFSDTHESLYESPYLGEFRYSDSSSSESSSEEDSSLSSENDNSSSECEGSSDEYNSSCEESNIDDNSSEVSEVILGDVDFDGQITVSDALMVLKNVVGVETFDEKQYTAANVDHNEFIDTNDALSILKYVVKLIEDFDCAD